MLQLGFTFDLNKCVGCQACHIACSIENDLGYDFSWREINTYNPDQIDTLPHYHLSLACNHCLEPVCLYQCPAKAIFKDPDNGIVIIDDNKCIGCKFCSWVCPYDAPQYRTDLKIMTKCTMCTHRIEEDLEPACVSICPTDALNISENIEFSGPTNIAGFPESKINPSIQIEALKPGQLLPEQYNLPYSKDVIEQYSKNKPQPKNKISLSSDWTLTVFTFLVSILGGWISTSIFSDIIVNPISFGLIGFIGMGLSTLHLGKKFLAYRAIFNWKTSWLSREILFFTLFMISSVVFLFIPEKQWLGYLALMIGFFAAISADNVYRVVAKVNKKFFHSAQVWLTMLFFICFFNSFIAGVLVLGLIKTIFYINNISKNKPKYILTFLRITSFLASIILLIQNIYFYAIVLIVLSELLDRIEFYTQLIIVTPKNHMEKKFYNDLR